MASDSGSATLSQSSPPAAMTLSMAARALASSTSSAGVMCSGLIAAKRGRSLKSSSGLVVMFGIL
ncbi:hypothetical protein D3C72_2049510 [compost metagenome]